ncbi:hypothetical protein BDY24DRAFT_190864 [Mrakia frigida]|uniref:uncharacterized protein n=1 Tax=Mrakia frigida TaxID=29902 RepID=UPI003FCC0B49
MKAERYILEDTDQSDKIKCKHAKKKEPKSEPEQQKKTRKGGKKKTETRACLLIHLHPLPFHLLFLMRKPEPLHPFHNPLHLHPPTPSRPFLTSTQQPIQEPFLVLLLLQRRSRFPPPLPSLPTTLNGSSARLPTSLHSSPNPRHAFVLANLFRRRSPARFRAHHRFH